MKTLATLSAVFSGDFATRMAAVFTLAATTAGRRAGYSRSGWWLSEIPFPVALLVSPSSQPWVVILFPLWVLMLSLHILVTNENESHQRSQ